MPPPSEPKIYHIVHVDKLPSIISDGWLWCDAEIGRRSSSGTTIGMGRIKQRRLNELQLNSHPGLFVGDCVPFYFCPRSIMLYIIYQANHPDIDYRGGQNQIIHLEADLKEAITWAEDHSQRWAFTLSNAGSYYFEDRCDIRHLDEINWNAVGAKYWEHCEEGKQAEFLIEQHFPWELVSRIGVCNYSVHDQALVALLEADHKPRVEIKSDWYY